MIGIDAHQHFWRYDAQAYGWIGPDMALLKRDYMPADLRPLQQEMGIAGTVAVQARQTLEETYWLLQLADEHPFIRGVVGWADLRDPEVGMALERMRAHPRLCGIRHVVQDEPDDQFLLGDAFCQGVGRLAEFDLAYDLLVMPRHLPAACALVERFPDQRFVLDHIAKPPIKAGRISPWDEDIRRLAAHPNVTCKVSGLVTQADWQAWQPDQVYPYLDVVFEAFGMERIMLASDWPVCTVAGSYARVMRLALDYVSQFSVSEQASLCGDNARRCYRLEG